MLIGVNTKNMEVDVAEDRISVSLDYELDVNHEPLADCRIRMGVMSKTAFPECRFPVSDIKYVPGICIMPQNRSALPQRFERM